MPLQPDLNLAGRHFTNQVNSRLQEYTFHLQQGLCGKSVILSIFDVRLFILLSLRESTLYIDRLPIPSSGIKSKFFTVYCYF